MTLRNLVATGALAAAATGALAAAATGALAAAASAAPPAVSLHPCPGDGFLPDAAAARDGAVHLVFHRGEADVFH